MVWCAQVSIPTPRAAHPAAPAAVPVPDRRCDRVGVVGHGDGDAGRCGRGRRGRGHGQGRGPRLLPRRRRHARFRQAAAAAGRVLRRRQALRLHPALQHAAHATGVAGQCHHPRDRARRAHARALRRTSATAPSAGRKGNRLSWELHRPPTGEGGRQLRIAGRHWRMATFEVTRAASCGPWYGGYARAGRAAATAGSGDGWPVQLARAHVVAPRRRVGGFG